MTHGHHHHHEYQSVPTGSGYYIGEDPLLVPVVATVVVPQKIYYPQPEMYTRLYLGGLTILGLYLLFRVAA